MEKMFYSIEEAAQKLSKSVDDVRQMATRGQLQEFRDRDKLMFKREQVDLLAGGDDGAIPLASDSGEISLSGSGTGMKMEPMMGGGKDDKDSTGISIFEAEGTDDADANAVTRVSSAPTMQDPGKSGSGSGGLLDLTKEADDTSLGAGLMEDVYGSETIAQQTAAETAIGAGSGDGALFESPSGTDFEAATGAGAMMAAAAPEAYDGVWSGIAGGISLGGAVVCLIGVFAVIIGFTSTTGGGLMNTLGDNFLAIIGGAVGVTAVAAGVGFALGKKS